MSRADDLRIFRVETRTFWGDFDDILINGIFVGRDAHGRLRIERTGPFVPPISKPCESVVVTESFKKAIEAQSFVGASFREAVIQKVTNVDWESWDRTIDPEPWQLPKRDPEYYILGRPHRPDLLDMMEHLYELILPEVLTAIPIVVNLETIRWDVLRNGSNVTDFDFMRRKESDDKTLYVSDRLRAWLEEQVGLWVEFQECPIVEE